MLRRFACGLALLTIEASAHLVRAQAPPEKSGEERFKAVERERDELKKRNADLEARLRGLQTTVDKLVRDAVGEQKNEAPPYWSAAPMIPQRPAPPFGPRFGPMMPPFQPPSSVVEMAVAFGDALGERDAALVERPKQSAEKGPGQKEADAASDHLKRAERKLEILRKIIATARDAAAADVERMHKLGAVHAVSTADVQYSEAKLKMLDMILAEDPNAPKRSDNGKPQPGKGL